MFDTDDTVVSNLLQCTYNIFPHFRAVPIPDGTENPRALQLLRVRLDIKNTV